MAISLQVQSRNVSVSTDTIFAVWLHAQLQDVYSHDTLSYAYIEINGSTLSGNANTRLSQVFSMRRS